MLHFVYCLILYTLSLVILNLKSNESYLSKERPSNPRSNQRNCTYSSLNNTYIFLLHSSIDDEVEEDEDENEGEEDAEEEEEETPPPSPRKKYVNMTCYLCRSLIFHMHPDPRPRLSDVTRLLKNEDTKKRTSYTTTLQHLY